VGTVEYYKTTTSTTLPSVNGNNETIKTEESYTVHDERPRYSFMVELAPLDLVPHAIHLFLEQVDHGLWNGTYFYMNGPHIIQCGPSGDEEEYGDSGWEWVEYDESDPSSLASGAAAARTRSRSRSLDEKVSTAAAAAGGGSDSDQPQHGRRLTAESSASTSTTTSSSTSSSSSSTTDRGGHDKRGSHHRSASEDEYSETDDYYYGGYWEQADLEETDEDRRIRKFADIGLDKLAFPDYHVDFPHIPWTLGYTGRPGGPDWYINKMDNTEGHGPGGQSQYALKEQGDSCFGIVSADGPGRQHLTDHAFQKETYNDRTDWHYFFKEEIEIVSAVVLTKQPQMEKIHLGHGLHQHHHGGGKNANHTNSATTSGRRNDHHHKPMDRNSGDGGTAEDFVQVLKNALEELPTNPSSTSTSTTTATASGDGDTKTTASSDPPVTATTAANNNNKDRTDRLPKHQQHRKPRLPKIDGAAEA
jgi:hypothetical protein